MRRTTTTFSNGGRVAHGFIDAGLQRHDAAAPPGAVAGDHHFGFGIVDALAQGFRGKSAEDNAVRRADFRAGEHGDGQLRHHAHVDRHAVALGHAQRAQRVREAVHFALQHPVGEHARIARLALPDDGRFIAPRGMRVAVDAVVGDVQLAADEPFHPGHIPVQHLVPGREPVQLLGFLGPESLRIAQGAFVNVRVAGIGLPAKVLRGRESAALLEQRGEAFFRWCGQDQTSLSSSPR